MSGNISYVGMFHLSSFRAWPGNVGIYQGSSYPSGASNYRNAMNRIARSIVKTGTRMSGNISYVGMSHLGSFCA